MQRIACLFFSTKYPLAAPLLKASSPQAPVPAKRSRICFPCTSLPKLENRRSRDESVLGRMKSPLGDFNFRLRAMPPVIRMRRKFFGLRTLNHLEIKECSMPSFHSFDPDISSTQTELKLGGEESHHLVRVRRAKVGDGVVVLNGRGLILEGEVLVADPRQALVRLSGFKEVSVEPPLFKLAVGIPKGRTVDTIVRQATELGVAEIHFLVTERSEVPSKVLVSAEKLAKWKRVGKTLQAWVEEFVGAGNHFVAHPERSGKICRFGELQDEQESVWLLAGPEGGLTEHELQISIQHGFQPVNLGTSILRVDTASVTLVALAQGFIKGA